MVSTLVTSEHERLPALPLDTMVLPTQVGRTATPRRTPQQLPAQFRVITQHTIDPPPVGRRSRITQPEYDLNEIAKAVDTDGLLRRAFDEHVTCIMKDGWSLAGRNDETKAYIQRRLDEFGFMGQLTFTQILRQAAQDLVEYNNFFVYLVRKANRSSGRPTLFHGKRVQPVATLHPIDATTMFAVLGDTTDLRAWVQFLDGRHVSGRSMFVFFEKDSKHIKRYQVEDVIHGWHRRRSGFIFGTPSAVPVLDDIRALRRLEEIAELIAHKHAFPLIHLKVGTETLQARILADGQSEVDVVRNQYNQMPLEGALVTSERITVEAIKTDPHDLSKLLTHFEQRAITGLGVSDIDLGRGGSSNRGTAVVLSKGLMNRCREYQNALSEFFTQLFDMLLLEDGTRLTPENRVFLMFPEIDIERRMALEKHAQAMYQGNLFTESEARLSMGRDPLKQAQRKDLHLERIQKPLAIIQAVDEPFTSEAKTAAKATTASTKKTANETQPTNQSGTKSAKSAPVNQRVRGGDMLQYLRDDLYAYLDTQLTAGAALSKPALQELVDAHREQIELAMLNASMAFVIEGFDRYRTETGTPTGFFYGPPLRNKFRKKCIAIALEPLLGPDSDMTHFLQTLCASTGDHRLQLLAFFESWTGRWERACDRLGAVAERFGYAHAAWHDDAHAVTWQFDQGCERCAVLSQQALTPWDANYYTLVDRDCAGTLGLIQTDRLPNRVPLEVSGYTQIQGSGKLSLTVPGAEDYLDLSHPNRFLQIFLDSGESAVLPGDSADGWDVDGSGVVHLPKFASGVAELWSDGRVVARTRFAANGE